MSPKTNLTAKKSPKEVIKESMKKQRLIDLSNLKLTQCGSNLITQILKNFNISSDVSTITDEIKQNGYVEFESSDSGQTALINPRYAYLFSSKYAQPTRIDIGESFFN